MGVRILTRGSINEIKVRKQRSQACDESHELGQGVYGQRLPLSGPTSRRASFQSPGFHSLSQRKDQMLNSDLNFQAIFSTHKL